MSQRLKFYRAKWQGCAGENPALVTWCGCAVSVTRNQGHGGGFNICFNGNFTGYAKTAAEILPTVIRYCFRENGVAIDRGNSRKPYNAKGPFFAHVEAELENPVDVESAAESYLTHFIIPN